MKRRQFLSLLPAFPGLALLPAGAGNGRNSVLVQRSALAGFQFHSAPRLWPRLREGQRLRLIREPNNEHDDRAVRVEWRGHHLGYLPGAENLVVSQMLDRGEPLYARIATMTPDSGPWKRILLHIWR